MSKKENLFPLKLVVISLGFILAGGFIFVVSVVLTKLPTALSKPQTPANCNRASVELPVSGTLLSTQIIGAHAMSIVATGPNEHTVFTFDRCTGTVQNTFTIHTKPENR